VIIWGTKILRLRQGRVADFCPMCREPSCFTVIRINSVGHLYFIPLGTGRTVAMSAVCESCGHEKECDPTIYRALAKKRSKDGVTALVKQTFPNLAEVYAERLELEAQVAKSSDNLATGVREALIREALVNITGPVEHLYSRTHGDWRVLVSVLAAIAIPLSLAALGGALSLPPEQDRWLMLAAAASALGGIVVAGYFAATSNGRELRRSILPRLVTALRPLRPRETELAALLERFKQSGLKAGRKLRAREIAAAIDPLLVKSLGR
jgi:hypothetical protein